MHRSAGTCLVMLSGGIDSTVLLYDLLDSKERPVALTRATKKREVQAAQEIAELVGVPHVVLNPHQQVASLLEAATFKRMQLTDHLGPNSFPHICSLADSISFAALLHIPRVVWGWRRAEMHELERPDLLPGYLDYINLHSQLRECPTVQVPFFEWSKRQVVQLGTNLGVPLERTYSCIHDQPKPCGTCRRCVERQDALRGFI